MATPFELFIQCLKRIYVWKNGALSVEKHRAIIIDKHFKQLKVIRLASEFILKRYNGYFNADEGES